MRRVKPVVTSFHHVRKRTKEWMGKKKGKYVGERREMYVILISLSWRWMRLRMGTSGQYDQIRVHK